MCLWHSVEQICHLSLLLLKPDVIQSNFITLQLPGIGSYVKEQLLDNDSDYISEVSEGA